MASGTCTLNQPSPLGVTGSTIFIDMVNCAAGQFFTVTYSGASAAPVAGSPYAFLTQTDIGPGGQGLVPITAGSPAVDVFPATLTVAAAGLTATGKTYDGTTAATLTIGSPTLVGVVGTDVVTLDTTGATAAFADRNAGAGKLVTIDGLLLGGADAGNYILTPPTRTASILQRPITVTAATDTGVYDGTTSSAGVPVLSAGTPLAAGDSAAGWTQSFDNRNVGIGKTLTPAGTVSDGNGGLNYAYTFVADTTGAITQRPVTVTAVTGTKAYDGTTGSTGIPVVSAGTPLGAGDSAPALTQSFDNRNVGTGKTLTPAGTVNDGNGGLNYAYTFVPVTTGAITRRPLRVTAVTDTKGYDGTTGSAGVPVPSAGTPLAPGDTAPAWTQSFDNRHAGTGKILTPSGTVSDGNGGLNYNYVFIANPTGVIVPRPLTVTAATDSKIYDGTTGSTGVPALSAATPLAPGDTAPAWTQGFENRNVGTGKILTPAGAVNDGNGGLNYAYTFAPDTTGVVAQRAITVTAATDTKVYDGTTNSAGAPVLSVGTPLAPGDAAPAWTQSFDTRNVGAGKSLTPAGAVNDGNGGLNYAYSFVAETTGAIAQRAITVTAATDTRMYDGTTVSAGVPVVSAATPLGAGDSAAALNQSFDTRHTGTGKTLTPAGTVNDGNGGLNYAYTFVPVANGTITQRPIAVTAATDTKVYDGTSSSNGAPVISAATPLAPGDSAAAFTQSFDTRHAGTGKTLTPAGTVNDGTGGLNYFYTFVSDGTGVITPRPLTVTAATDTRVYDGTAGSTGVPVLSAATPLAPGDSPPAWSQSFNNRNVGTGKTLTPAGTVNDGNGGLNYSCSFVADTTGVISPLPITVTAVADTKIYDGTPSSTGAPVLAAGTPLAAGDSAPAWTQSFDNRNAGTGKTLTPAGTVSDGNGGQNYAYTFVANSTGAITRRPVTLTAVTATKVYDGTTASTGTPVVSAGTPLAAGDSAPALTQTYDTRNVGTGKTLTPAGTVSDGNGGLNYTYTFVADTTGAITQRAATVTAVTDTKIYDGTTSSVGVPVLSAGTPLAAGDSAPVWTQSFDSRNAGAGKTLTPAGTVSDGNGGLNYACSFVASATGVITPRPITVTAVTDTKVYDGTTASTGVPLLSATTPLAPGDTAPAWTQSFTTSTVGTGKTLTPAGTVVDGNGGSNYAYTFVADTTGVIMGRPITVTAVPDSKGYDGTVGSIGVPVLSAATPLAAGDTAPAWTQSFDTRNVGAGKSLIPAGVVNDGQGGQSYVYNFVPDTTGVITPRAITVTAVPDSKIYDGTTGSAGVPFLSGLTPLAPGDTEPAWTQSFDTAHAGTGKTLTPAGAVADGNSGLNYAYTFTPDATGAITPRPVTVAADAQLKGLGTADPPLTFQVTAGSLIPGDSLTLTRAPGEAPGKYPITIGSFPAASDYDLTYLGSDLTITPTLRFFSDGALDGWVLESSRTSSVGGTADSKATTFRLGDDPAGRQYRAILSFDTSLLPDTAVIQNALLEIRRSGAPTGTNPFGILGKLRADVRKGTFGPRPLAPTDFQAVPTLAGAGIFGATPVGPVYRAKLTALGRSKVNTAGITQFRLSFAMGDNGDRGADFMKFVSGNTATGQPQLTITYTLP